jgi:AraC-like DNA-binding protein
MTDDLLSAARWYADRNADAEGIARTSVPGLTVIRATRPSDLQYAISRPLAAFVVQGRKRVAIGAEAVEFGAGDSLIVTADVPTVSSITRAAPTEPYLSVVLDLDLSMIADLALELGAGPVADGSPVRVEPTDRETADAALRLIRLLDRPRAAAVLQTQLLREMHYWLLAGRHGPAIRRLAWPNSSARRVAAAVERLRSEFAKPLRVEHLAQAVGMSASSFHEHFRAATSLTPLQFQKQLRLIEARRLMLSEGLAPSAAGFAVGYASTPQFTREYGRMYGLPPGRDVEAARARAHGLAA